MHVYTLKRESFERPTSATLTITTPAVSATLGQPKQLFVGTMLTFPVCCFSMRRGQVIRLLSILVAVTRGILPYLWVWYCFGSAAASRQPLTSSILVIAIAGSQQHAASFSLTVESAFEKACVKWFHLRCRLSTTDQRHATTRHASNTRRTGYIAFRQDGSVRLAGRRPDLPHRA